MTENKNTRLMTYSDTQITQLLNYLLERPAKEVLVLIDSLRKPVKVEDTEKSSEKEG